MREETPPRRRKGRVNVYLYRKEKEALSILD